MVEGRSDPAFQRGEAPGTVGEEASQCGAGSMYQRGRNQAWNITRVW